jgi:hypothetical protein
MHGWSPASLDNLMHNVYVHTKVLIHPPKIEILQNVVAKRTLKRT